MAYDGEAITQVFTLIAENPTPSNTVLNLPSARLFDCCTDKVTKVFADLTTTDEFSNDKTSFIYSYNEVVNSVVLTLELFNPISGNWETAEIITNNNLGVYNPYGFFVDGLNKYISFICNWRSVLNIYGAFSYRLKIEITLSIGGGKTSYSNEYCLENYTPERVDGTVKIEYYLNNIFGDNTDDTKRRNFAEINLYNSLRIPGFFGFNSSTYEREFIVYQNGARNWVKDEQTPEYTLITKRLSVEILDLLRTDVMQSEDVYITDYNSFNPNRHVKRKVTSNSDFAPNWQPKSKLASVTLKFNPAFNNYKRRRC